MNECLFCRATPTPEGADFCSDTCENKFAAAATIWAAHAVKAGQLMLAELLVPVRVRALADLNGGLAGG